MASPTNKVSHPLLVVVLLAILLLTPFVEAAWLPANLTGATDSPSPFKTWEDTPNGARLAWTAFNASFNGQTIKYLNTTFTCFGVADADCWNPAYSASGNRNMYIDLGASYNLTHYGLRSYAGGNNLVNWTVAVSSDNTTYTLWDSKQAQGSNSQQFANYTPTNSVNARYVRFTGGKGATNGDVIVSTLVFYSATIATGTPTPNITFTNRTPSDITSTVLFSQSASFVYQYNTTALNSAFINYYANSSLHSCLVSVNGSCLRNNGTTYTMYGSFAGATQFENVTYSLTENDIYPSISNRNTSVASSNVINVTGTNNYVVDRYNNISTSLSYGFYELQLNSTGTVTVYYFNSSYDFNSNPDLSDNVHELCSLNGSQVNHSHSASNWDMICPFPVNGSGYVDTTKVTSSGGFIIRGNTQGVRLYGYAGAVRDNVTMTSSNNGLSWTASNTTLRTHLHQFGSNDSFCWSGSGNFTTGTNPQTNGTMCDAIDVTPLPPSAPTVNTPAAGEYNLSINISYDASQPYSTATIRFYNITLLNNDSTFNSTIRGNNSLNTSFLWYFYTLNLTENQEYIVRVTAVDSLGLSSFDDSEPFTVYGNALVNISFRNKFTGQSVSNFYGWYYDTVTGDNFTFNSSGTNLSQIAMWTNRNYTIYSEQQNYSISSDNFKYNYSTTKNNDNYSFSVYSENSIIAYIFSQSTGALIQLNFTVNLLSDNYTLSNTTTTGVYYIDGVQDGAYTLRFINANYTSTSYFVTVADRSTQVVNAYLTANTSQVIIRVLKAESLEPIEGATVSQYRAVNGSNVIIESRATDVSGRALFGYIADQRYGFVVQKTDYTSTSFTLDPVLFSSYDVQLLLSSGAASTDIALSDVGVEFSPKSYYSTKPNVFRITFTSANGELSYYNVSINHTKYNYTAGGVHAGGGTLNTTFNLTGAAKNENIFVRYCYKKVGFDETCFMQAYEVIGNYSVGTWINTKTDGYGMEIGDKTLIATGVIIVGASIGMMVSGVSGGAVFGLLLMWMFAAISFLPLWGAIIGTIVSFLLLTRAGGAR